MNRPLWQILFTSSFAAFAVARIFVGHALQRGPVHPVLLAIWGLVLLLAGVLAAGVLLERRWPVAALTVAVGALLAGSALLRGTLAGGKSAAASASEVLVIALVTGALGLALRRGRRSPFSRADGPRRVPRGPARAARRRRARARPR